MDETRGHQSPFCPVSPLHEGSEVRTRIWIALALLVPIGILTARVVDPVVKRIISFQLLRERISEVDVSDGIQRDEANLIATEYSSMLLGELDACSGTTSPTLANDESWKAEILFGYGGEPTGRWIRIDRIRGGVSSPAEPTYDTFDSFRRARLLSVILHGR